MSSLSGKLFVRAVSSARVACAVALAVAASACVPEPWEGDGVVTMRTLQVQARGTDLVQVIVVAPDGGRGPEYAKRRGLVLAPGGFVDPESYVDLAKRLVERGWVVAIPSFPLGLGFFSPDNAIVAADLLLEGDRTNALDPLASEVVMSGHSLGGVVAAAVATRVHVSGLILFASQANGSDPVETLPVPVLSVAGAGDCTFPLATAKQEFKRFPAETSLFATVTGLAHMGYTDDVSLDKSNGCLPADMPALSTLHDTLADLIDLFARARIGGEIDATRQLADGLPGVTFGAE